MDLTPIRWAPVRLSLLPFRQYVAATRYLSFSPGLSESVSELVNGEPDSATHTTHYDALGRSQGRSVTLALRIGSVGETIVIVQT